MNLMDKRGLYYQLVKRQTEQNDTEIRTQLKEINQTTISIGIPLTDKKYSNSFNAKESI
jgi:hypothetical protein